MTKWCCLLSRPSRPHPSPGASSGPGPSPPTPISQPHKPDTQILALVQEKSTVDGARRSARRELHPRDAPDARSRTPSSTRNAYRDMQEEQRGAFYGLGIVISKRGKDKPLTVISPIDGTPAVPDGDPRGRHHQPHQGQGRERRRGHARPRGSRRGQVPARSKGFEVTIPSIARGWTNVSSSRSCGTRSRRTRSRTHFMIAPGTGYIKLINFTQTSTDELDRTRSPN